MAFQGDKKEGQSLLMPYEAHLRDWLLPRVPKRVETYHLTMLTLVWSGLIIVFSFLAKHNIHWLWAVSVMIFAQYITDLLDGAIGRLRDTGLVKWGYYMDHFLDYLFLCAILIGYSLLLPDAFKYRLFYIMAIFGAFMVNSFLSFAATNAFKIAYMGVGPTEMRLVFILINTVLIIFGRENMLVALPYVLVGATFALFVTVYRTQKVLWVIDMQAKHEKDMPDDEAQPSSRAAFARELAASIRTRRIVPNMLFSGLIGGVALLTLAMRVGYPNHQVIAFSLYALSWVPLFMSFQAKRAFVRRHRSVLKKKVQPYLLHLVVAIVLVVMGRSAWVLAPGQPGIAANLSDGELAESISQDAENLHILNNTLDALVAFSGEDALFREPVTSMSDEQIAHVHEFWGNFTDACMELEILRRRYKDFQYVDFLVKPGLHADAFFIAFSAFVTQYDVSLQLSEQLNENALMETLLNEPNRVSGLPANSYSAMVTHLTHPDELLRLNAGAAYLLLVRKHLGVKFDLPSTVEARLSSIYKGLGSRPKRLLDSPLDAIESAAFKAWFPFQKSVAIQMSHIRTTKRENFVTPALIQEQQDALQPGDILLERRNWFMTNVGIPGFWPHAALYLGSPAALDTYFDGLPELEGRPASVVLTERYAAATSTWRGADDMGPLAVIEAVREGVIFKSLESSANADYVAALRPRISRADAFKAVAAALSHFGKPYDYNFDFATDSALVCSELVFKSYREAQGLDFALMHINGRPILPPNRIAQKFDDDFGTDQQQLDLVFFLDGNEAQQTAALADDAAFRASWRRPKWDVLQK
jgi:phosphatidylglycerophosphate synthase